MQMVWHYDKVVEPEFPGRYVGAKHVDHQRGIPFRLQQGAALAGVGGGEERTRRTQYVARKSMARRSCHHQGLKPHSFHGSARLKPCPDTNQIITSCSRPGRSSCLVSGHGFSRAVGGSQFRALAPAAFLPARYVKQEGNSSGLSTSPAFTGFAAMYSRCFMKLCRHSTRVSEKPPCQTSPQWPHSFFTSGMR